MFPVFVIATDHKLGLFIHEMGGLKIPKYGKDFLQFYHLHEKAYETETTWSWPVSRPSSRLKPYGIIHVTHELFLIFGSSRTVGTQADCTVLVTPLVAELSSKRGK